MLVLTLMYYHTTIILIGNNLIILTCTPYLVPPWTSPTSPWEIPTAQTGSDFEHTLRAEYSTYQYSSQTHLKHGAEDDIFNEPEAWIQI